MQLKNNKHYTFVPESLIANTNHFFKFPSVNIRIIKIQASTKNENDN